jgi:hypothetical protein
MNHDLLKLLICFKQVDISHFNISFKGIGKVAHLVHKNPCRQRISKI